MFLFLHIFICLACFASYLNFKSLFPANFNLKMAPNSETDIATLCFLVFIGRGLHTATIIQQIRPKLQHMQRISFGFTSRLYFIEENKPLTLNQADPQIQNHIGQNAQNVQ